MRVVSHWFDVVDALPEWHVEFQQPTPVKEPESRLREAMDRYGFTDADRGHAKGGPCWCLPGVKSVAKHRGAN